MRFSFLFLAFAFAAHAETLKLASGTIDFYAIVKPSMLKIHGESSKLTGTVSQKQNVFSADLQVPLESFETGMKVRDDHLKHKVFETEKFKTATLLISPVEIPAGKTGEVKDLPFTGKLKLHGVEKDISGTATLIIGDKTIRFDAATEVKMSDYQIPPPEFMGMTMKDDVKINAKGEAKL